MKRLVQLSLITALLAFTVLAIPTTNKSVAHAATVTPNIDTTHCASLGTNIETKALIADGITLGYLEVYYNRSNGYNCAEAVSSSATYGQSKNMVVTLQVCNETSPSNNTCNGISDSLPYYDYDGGDYSYYAGPAGVYGKGHCINAYASIQWNGHLAYYEDPGADHCG